MHVTGSSRADVDFCHFRGNNGTEVGSIKISDETVVRISQTLFEFNFGVELANEIYVTDDATGLLDESSVYGDNTDPEFDAFLIDGSRPENEAEDFGLPSAAVAAVTGRATALFTDCLVSGHIGQFGAIYVTDSTLFSAVRTDFTGNRAVTGAGLFVNAERNGFARVLQCNFTDNLARNGGGLVFAGDLALTSEIKAMWLQAMEPTQLTNATSKTTGH